MGFINYHGKKEDRYTEVLQYSRAQQDEEWKKSEEERIGRWLEELIGDVSYAQLNIQELLKALILRYRAMYSDYMTIVQGAELPKDCDSSRLWKDFSIDIVDRHIRSFHVSSEVEEKHLQTFIEKIFKLEGVIPAAKHLEYISGRMDYRRYFMECFDPTWSGRQFYHLLRYIGKNKMQALDAFHDGYKTLTLVMNLYFYQAFRPGDDGWMSQIEAERTAIDEMAQQYARREHIALDPALLWNPLYIQAATESAATDGASDSASDNADSPLEAWPERKHFLALVEARGIPNYLKACKLLLAHGLPEEIEDNYRKLAERLPVLQDAIEKFDNVYHADMYLFDDYFAPEAFRLTASLIEYEYAKPSDEILTQLRENVKQASKKLVQVVNEKIEEIYRFAAIETNAQTRALEALMSQAGYVDSEYKINVGGHGDAGDEQ